MAAVSLVFFSFSPHVFITVLYGFVVRIPSSCRVEDSLGNTAVMRMMLKNLTVAVMLGKTVA